MFLSEFDYDLPDELIARYPTETRSDSRLMVIDAALKDRVFTDLPDCLRTNDLLVFNDTRVIRARLEGKKPSGGRVEILVERLQSEFKALALLRASKSPKPGSVIHLPHGCEALVVGRDDDLFQLNFSTPVAAYLQMNGSMPLPPYLGRNANMRDDDRYQTVYARRPGAVAAPTAGLHFDAALLSQLERAGINTAYVTLHVGAGTFQSLRHENVTDNELHAEQVIVDQNVCDAVAATHAAGGRVIAVGTTSVRALESACSQGKLRPFADDTRLFIYPGYEFAVVDAMITNFHLPKSSLLMLVSAFAGYDRIRNAYRHAIRDRYRFFSYGDAMLVFPSLP